MDITLETQPVSLPIDQAIPCGIIVNELMTNSLKYAFPGGTGGVLYVGCGMENDRWVRLVVGDNGVGLPRGFDAGGKEDTLGMRLVSLLVEDQLKGKLTVERGKGAGFCIVFPP